MKLESFNQHEDLHTPEAREKREVEVYADIQKELIIRSIRPGDDLEAHAMEWATGQDAVTFAAAYEGLKGENPNLVEDYDKDCEEVIAAIRARMNLLSTPLHKAA
ncbi:MAG: hypothetical protein V4465_02985 [Patescibacteria group bacterium]